MKTLKMPYLTMFKIFLDPPHDLDLSQNSSFSIIGKNLQKICIKNVLF